MQRATVARGASDCSHGLWFAAFRAGPALARKPPLALLPGATRGTSRVSLWRGLVKQLVAIHAAALDGHGRESDTRGGACQPYFV